LWNISSRDAIQVQAGGALLLYQIVKLAPYFSTTTKRLNVNEFCRKYILIVKKRSQSQSTKTPPQTQHRRNHINGKMGQNASSISQEVTTRTDKIK